MTLAKLPCTPRTLPYLLSWLTSLYYTYINYIEDGAQNTCSVCHTCYGTARLLKPYTVFVRIEARARIVAGGQEASSLIVAGSRMVAGFATIDTNASRLTLLCSLAAASRLSHFTVAKDHQSCKSDV